MISLNTILHCLLFQKYFSTINNHNVKHTKHFSLMTCTKVTLNFGFIATENEILMKRYKLIEEIKQDST